MFTKTPPSIIQPSNYNLPQPTPQEIMSETRNNVAGAIGAAHDIAAKTRSTLNSYDRAPLAQLLPSRTRETVRLENESEQAILEKKKTNPISSLLESITKPKPIVDNIREEEKYGNNGDKFIGVGRALVNGFEGLSNFLNAIVDVSYSHCRGFLFCVYMCVGIVG